ncbi:ATP/GTP-binding protein [Streptomyces phaeochromogenes]
MHNGQPPADGEATVESSVRPVCLAPLKDGLPPEKRALAEDLRSVFLALGISVRRYAARRHLDASSVTRYLSGARVPPWDFVAGVIADVQEAKAPLTCEAEMALRDLHRAALKSNRRSSEVQVLQDKLEDADEETRRIKTRERALEEALQDRETRLAEVRGRSRKLEVRLEEQRLAHRAEVEVWQAEHEQLEDECGDLQEQVVYLQEALTVTRAELIAAEEQCHRLESQLETLQELGQDRSDSNGPPSLMVMLEEADRTASVPELVRVVGDLELRTRQAMASELVRSASQSRTVEEVAGLLAALRQAGYDAHAQTALPTMVMMRPVDDISALARELFRDGLEDYVLTLLRASVEFHRPEDVAAFALALHHAELPEHAESLLGAVAAVRPVDDLVSVTAALAGGELDSAMTTAMSSAAARRTVNDLGTLSLALRKVSLSRFTDALHLAAAAQRSASDVVQFVDTLSLLGLGQDADKVFDETQNRGVGHLIALIYVLLQSHRYDDAWSVLLRAAESRPTDDIAALITDFYGAGRRQYAAELLILTALGKAASQIRALISALDEVFPGSRTIVRTAAASSRPRDVAALLTCLEQSGLLDLAEVVFEHTMSDRAVSRHLGEFLSALDEDGSRYVEQEALKKRAGDAAVPLKARLLLALESASLGEQLDAVVRGCCEECTLPLITLLVMDLDTVDSRRDPLSWSVVERILRHVVRIRSIADQAALSGAFQATHRTRYAEFLIAEATAAHGRQFKEELKKERIRFERQGISRALGFTAR